MAEIKYQKLFHNNSSIKTLEEFMSWSKINTGRISVNDLFELNRDAIFSQMSMSDKISYAEEVGKENWTELSASDLKSDMTLPCPCVMQVPQKSIDYVTAIANTNFEVQNDDVYAFENEQIQKIVQNPGYKIDNRTSRMHPDCCVFGWFKSLYYMEKDKGDAPSTRSSDQKIIDISDFVINLTTNVELGGGNFSITLPVIDTKQKDRAYGTKQLNVEIFNQTINAQISLWDKIAEKRNLLRYGDKDKFFYHKTNLDAVERNYFNWLIQSNDLIFISFEPLELEYDENTTVFDMIGLVDTVVVSQNANGQSQVIVQGRDLMRLLNDDSSLFFSYMAANDKSQIFANSESAGLQGDINEVDGLNGSYVPVDRLRGISGEMTFMSVNYNRTIDFVLKSVVSLLANIQVVPDSVFEDWGDRRTRFAEITPDFNASMNSPNAGSVDNPSNTSDTVPQNPAMGYRGDYGNVNPYNPNKEAPKADDNTQAPALRTSQFQNEKILINPFASRG